MAQRKPAEDEDDTLELTPDMQVDEPPEDEPGEEGEDEPEGEEGEGEEAEDEGVPAFEEGEGEDEGETDNAVIRRMRERLKELDRENAELRKQTPAPEMELGPKPTLDNCDYDEAEYERRLDSWKDRARQIADAKTEKDKEAEAAQREWEGDLRNYERQREELKLPDFETATGVIQAALTLAQQAVIVKAASRPAAFIYALSKSDARLTELAKIQDPIKMAAAIARMEGGVKVVKKRKAPAPDKPASGTGRMPGTTDKHLEKLEAEADRTGDRTELIAYRKKLKKRGK